MAVCFEYTVGKLQAITYFVSVLLSFCVVIPVGITLRNFQGSCILFAQVVWDGKTIWPWSETACDFVLYFNLGATLLYAFFMGIYSCCVAVPLRFPFGEQHYNRLKTLEEQDRKFRILGTNPVFMLINSVVVCLVMCNAVIISVGLDRFCDWMEDALEASGTPIQNCHEAQKVDWSTFRIIRGETMGVRGSQFYTCLGIAMIASWLLLMTWVFQWILNFSQSFTMCSCEVAEEKRKPDQASRIAHKRSQMATPLSGLSTPGGRGTPPGMGPGAQPMRPYTFQQQRGPPHQPYVMRQPPQQQQHQHPQQQQHQHPQQQQQQQQQPMQMRQGYAPPRI